jgi:hypothetical protein
LAPIFAKGPFDFHDLKVAKPSGLVCGKAVPKGLSIGRRWRGDKGTSERHATVDTSLLQHSVCQSPTNKSLKMTA